MKLEHCKKCNQMTNHVLVCLKCETKASQEKIRRHLKKSWESMQRMKEGMTDV